MKDRVMMVDRYFLALGVCLAIATALGGRSCVAQETLQDMLAAQIRMQGFVCDKPASAVRDAERSKPDHAVWVLECGNATYRISRVPDMAAKVEQLK
jgi:hypothetical protein